MEIELSRRSERYYVLAALESKFPKTLTPRCASREWHGISCRGYCG